MNRDKALEKLADNKHVWDFNVSPVTRVAGYLAVHAVIDFEQRRVLDARIENAQYCGYELLTKFREPSDAVHIASRARGTSSVRDHGVSPGRSVSTSCT